MQRLPLEQRSGKVEKWDYDYISSLSDEAGCPYFLTEQEIQAILTPLAPIAWLNGGIRQRNKQSPWIG